MRQIVPLVPTVAGGGELVSQLVRAPSGFPFFHMPTPTLSRRVSASPFKLYNNFYYMRVRSFILNGVPFPTRLRCRQSIVAIDALPVAYRILATISGRFFSSQATASGPSTMH